MIIKVEISGVLEVKTGLHIGSSDSFSAIGAVDATVIRDPWTNLPMIPGSSLKGKMRTLLARQYNEEICEPNKDAKEILELFGCALEGKHENSKKITRRVLFFDMVMNNQDELRKHGLDNETEIKSENTISRSTAVATPRQIERVVHGAKFPLDLVYEIYGDNDQKENFEPNMKKDFEILKEGFQLLKYDYLGGNGSRGYGKVKITDLKVETRIGEVSEEALKACQELLDEIK